jgi:hypothetical protein
MAAQSSINSNACLKVRNALLLDLRRRPGPRQGRNPFFEHGIVTAATHEIDPKRTIAALDCVTAPASAEPCPARTAVPFLGRRD